MTKNVRLQTGKTGTIAFRGFYGHYELVITRPDGTQQTKTAHLRENADNQWTFTL